MEQSQSDPPLPHPPVSFLESEADYDAHLLLGSFTHDLDYEICLTISKDTGNNFVYKSKAIGRPLRAFIVGTVSALDASRNPENQNAVTQHVAIRHLAHATDKAKIFFYNDVFTLRATIEAELNENCIVTRKWCVEDEEHESNSTIYVECSYAAKRVHGPFTIGSNVVIDASLHRRDLRVEGTLTRSYYLVTHEIEVVSRKPLELAGLVVPESFHG